MIATARPRQRRARPIARADWGEACKESFESEDRRPSPAWGAGAAGRGQVSDREGRAAGAIVTDREGGNGAVFGRRAERPDSEVEARRESGQVRRDQRRRLRGELAERAMVVAIAPRGGGPVFAVRVDAERRRVAESRLQLRRHRRDIDHRRRRSWCGQGLVIRSGKKLEDERQRGNDGRQRRTERRAGGPSRPSPTLSLARALHRVRLFRSGFLDRHWPQGHTTIDDNQA